MIVTHNMQQAARVADMTAFFCVEVGAGRRAHRRPRRVRPDGEDLHHARRQADRGLRHGEVRMMRSLASRRSSTSSRPALHEESELVLRSLRGARRARLRAGRRARGRGDRVRRRRRRAVLRGRAGDRAAARAPDARRQRPAARARDAARTTSTSSGWATYCVTIAKLTKLTKGLPPDDDLLDGFKEMGERAEQMIRVALRSLARARPCRAPSRSSSSTS